MCVDRLAGAAARSACRLPARCHARQVTCRQVALTDGEVLDGAITAVGRCRAAWEVCKRAQEVCGAGLRLARAVVVEHSNRLRAVTEAALLLACMQAWISRYRDCAIVGCDVATRASLGLDQGGLPDRGVDESGRWRSQIVQEAL